MLLLCSSLALLSFYSLKASALPPPASPLDLNAPNDLFLPTLENITFPLTNAIETTLNATNPPVTCYTNDPFPAPRTHQPVDLVQCLAIFPSFLLRPKALETQQWTPQAPLPLPHTFHAGDCGIELSQNYGNAKDTFQEVEILQRAAVILIQCFKGRPVPQRLGGTVSVGGRGSFQVTVSKYGGPE